MEHKNFNNHISSTTIETYFSLVVFVLQVCFLPPCHFLPKVLRVHWALDSLVHHSWAMVVCSLAVLFFHADSRNVYQSDHYLCVDF